jgi:hypothetical protein
MLRAEARQKLEILREQRQFFRNEVNNNKETESQISVITCSTIRLRDDYNTLLKTIDELMSEVSKLIYGCQLCRSRYLKITVLWDVMSSSNFYE